MSTPVKKIRSLALIIATTSLLAGVGCLSGISESIECNDSAGTSYAGTWNGNFGGDDFGSWTLDIPGLGPVTGSGVSNSDGAFSINGTFSAPRILTAGIMGTGATWKGEFCGSNVSGTWENRGDSGSFKGVKQ